MSSRRWRGLCRSLVVAIPATVLILAASTTAFLLDAGITKRDFLNGPATTRKENSSSLALAAGGFGKAPAGKKKKKNAKKKGKKNNGPPVPHYIPYDDSEFHSPQQATRTLLEWLDEEEVEGLEDVEIGFSKASAEDATDGLRGVFAKRDFRAGEYVMAVPYVTTLLVDEDFDPSTDDPGAVLLRADEPEAGFQFWEKFFCLGDDDNDDDKHSAFLDSLPMTPDDPNFDETPDFWSEEDIRRLEIPSVVGKTLARKASIGELGKRILEDMVADDSDDNGNDSDNNSDGSDLEFSALATIQQCCWLVQSRAFTTYKKAMSIDGSTGLLSRVVLIPFIDMINHASRSFANAEMQVVETKEYDESFYALVATKPIRKGTEIRICYGTGEESSLEIFCKYGFWPEVEDKERERASVLKLLEGVKWTSTLEEDQAMLATEEGSREPMRTILSTRIYAKSLLV